MQSDERQDERQRYPERLVVLVPEGMKSELAKVARERSMTKSELCRQLVLKTIMPNRPKAEVARRETVSDRVPASETVSAGVPLPEPAPTAPAAPDVEAEIAAALHAVESEHAAREAAFGGID
jgi:hypothetical protein